MRVKCGTAQPKRLAQTLSQAASHTSGR
jgi:hypothetical protein